MLRTSILALSATIGVASTWLILTPEQREAAGSLKAAERLIASMPAMRGKLVMPYGDDRRTTWAFTPGPRPGVDFKEMSGEQQKLGLDLLRTSLSEAGYKKVAAIRELEPILRELENGNPGRDRDLYWFMIFGELTAKGEWCWRYEGHHVSLTFTYRDGHIVSSTPQFLGSNPAVAKDGTEVLRLEEILGKAFLRSLNETQRKAAVLSDSAPADIASSNLRKAAILEDRGVAFKDLDKVQKQRLKELVELYASILKPGAREQRLGRIGDWEPVKFAWMGADEAGKGHYYRIQGPTFLIEFDNTQNNANHIHTVWRDFEGDFGADPLEEHYAHGHHRHD